MKQLIQNYRTGRLELAEVPMPVCSAGKILVQNEASFISLGTERSIIELGKKSLMGKAKARPDLVKRFVDKAKKEGLVKTFKEALDRLDSPTSLGYSSAGTVIESGRNVHKFSPGDRVACIGAGYALHAEFISLPENLVCKIPPGLTCAEASSGMLGIIALHGIRCTQSNAGEIVAVIGLGLLGLLALQILRACGFNVIGMDVDHEKIKIAKNLGVDAVYTDESEFRNGVDRISNSYGADAVIITASTQSDAPVNTAVDLVRFGGKIVVVGVADIHPQRNEMWHKEVEIIVSKAGGPGIFDPLYENKGIDYPVGYIRWTQNRNLEAYLRLLAEKKVDVNRLISHQFKFENAETVYADMLADKGGPYTGVVFNYPGKSPTPQVIHTNRRTLSLGEGQKSVVRESDHKLRIGVIGAGLFGRSLLLPALKNIPTVSLKTLATASGANTYHIGKKYGFQEITTDFKEVLTNPNIDAVVILTPHSQHAPMVVEALGCEKHVFVEKPLCVNTEELKKIVTAYQDPKRSGHLNLQVGYNRRFSPHAVKAVELLHNRHDPVVINYRVNAGFVPGDHWVHSEEEGGSRVVGEICHFVDLMQYLCGCDPVRVFAERISGNNKTSLNSDNLVVNLKFGDGSVGNLVYSASGDKAFSRERVEIFWEGKTIVIDDYRRSDYHFAGRKKTYKTINQQMGYKEELQHFCDTACNVITPVLTANESFVSTLCIFKINQALEEAQPCEILLPTFLS
jgi:predicted dehydrogenase/threonine dehydrogenase-like Zn-dependent dehydrogenase